MVGRMWTFTVMASMVLVGYESYLQDEFFGSIFGQGLFMVPQPANAKASYRGLWLHFPLFTFSTLSPLSHTLVTCRCISPQILDANQEVYFIVSLPCTIHICFKGYQPWTKNGVALGIQLLQQHCENICHSSQHTNDMTGLLFIMMLKLIIFFLLIPYLLQIIHSFLVRTSTQMNIQIQFLLRIITQNLSTAASLQRR